MNLRSSLRRLLTDHILILLTILVVAAFLRVQVRGIKTIGIDQDELQHLHAAWNISRGQLLYHDFFEHHFPGFYLVLQPFFWFFDVANRFDDATGILFACRKMAAVMTLAATLLTGRLAKTLHGGTAGWAAMVFLVTTLVFREKMSESRPDLFTLAFIAIALWRLATAAGRTEAGKIWRCLVGAGCALGAGIMFSQKVLLLGPGLAAAALYYVVYPSPVARSVRLKGVLAFALGTAVPILGVASYFLAHGNADEFIRNNLLLNAHWVLHFSPMVFFIPIVQENLPLAMFAAIGLGRGLIRLGDRTAFASGEFVGVFVFASLFVVMYLMPVPHRQFFLLFMPVAASFAGAGLAWSVQSCLAGWELWRSKRRPKFTLFVLPAALAVLFALTINVGLPLLSPEDIRNVSMASAVVLVLIVAAAHWRTQGAAMALLLAAFTYYPYQLHLLNLVYSHNDETLLGIRTVMEQSRPDETFFDGWTGYGVFRPNANYYFFFHDELLAMLSGEQKATVATQVMGGTPPRFLVFDRLSKQLSPDLTPWVASRYDAVPGVKDLYKSRAP